MSDRDRTTRNRRLKYYNNIIDNLPLINMNNINSRQKALAYRTKPSAGLSFASRIVLWHHELPAKHVLTSFLRYCWDIIDFCRLAQVSDPEIRRQSRDNQGVVNTTNRDRSMYGMTWGTNSAHILRHSLPQRLPGRQGLHQTFEYLHRVIALYIMGSYSLAILPFFFFAAVVLVSPSQDRVQTQFLFGAI
jgi:hypothetical protein